MVKYYYDRYSSKAQYGFGSEISHGSAGGQWTSLALKVAIDQVTTATLPDTFYSTITMNPDTGAVTLGGISNSGTADLSAILSPGSGNFRHFNFQTDQYNGMGYGYATITASSATPGYYNVAVNIYTKSTNYIKGSLSLSNIQAEDGTYPIDGHHTDGHWYVRKGVVNTAPTTPTINVPTIQFEHGDKHMISFSSTDAENNPITYTLDAIWNNGASTTNIYKGTAKAFEFTVPSDKTHVQFRVKASDGSLETIYVESTVKTIQKVMYHWSKYESQSKKVYKDTAPWEFYRDDSHTYFSTSTTGVIMTPETGEYLTNGKLFGFDKQVEVGMVCYGSYDGDAREYTATQSGSSNDLLQASMKVKYKNKNTFDNVYYKGSLVEIDVQAAEGTYPLDGKHTDGFWYVRGQRVLDTVDTTPPIIELREQEAYGTTSSVYVKGHDISKINVLKYAKGLQSIDYFTSNGTVMINGQSFTATENIIYTVYARDGANNKAIETIQITRVNTPPAVVLKDAKGVLIANNDSRSATSIYDAFAFDVIASDTDENSSLTYSVEIDNVEFVGFKAIEQYTSNKVLIPANKIGVTSSLVSVKVKDDKGVITQSNFTIANKIPKSHCNTHVYEHILKFM